MAVILRIGAPISFKNMFINLSMIFVNAQINSLGVIAVAVTGICAKLQSLMQVVSQAMMDGTASMVGQNIGAGKTKQVNRVVWDATLVGLVFAAVLSALFLLLPYQIFRHFLPGSAGHRPGPALYGGVLPQRVRRGLDGPPMGPHQRGGRHPVQYGSGHRRRRGGPAGPVPALRLRHVHGGPGLLLGNCSAGFVSVLGGGLYFLMGWWKRKGLPGPAPGGAPWISGNCWTAPAPRGRGVLLAQVLDRMELAQRRQEPQTTCFLSPKEQRDAQALLNAAGHPRYAALGGYPEAERRVLVFLPDWLEEEFLEPGDYLTALRCRWFQGTISPTGTCWGP